MTDHKSLKYFMTIKKQSRRQFRHIKFLSGFFLSFFLLQIEKTGEQTHLFAHQISGKLITKIIDNNTFNKQLYFFSLFYNIMKYIFSYINFRVMKFIKMEISTDICKNKLISK